MTTEASRFTRVFVQTEIDINLNKSSYLLSNSNDSLKSVPFDHGSIVVIVYNSVLFNKITMVELTRYSDKSCIQLFTKTYIEIIIINLAEYRNFII